MRDALSGATERSEGVPEDERGSARNALTRDFDKCVSALTIGAISASYTAALASMCASTL